LFNWLPGEMDDVPADIMRKLQVRGRLPLCITHGWRN
jgi:hypothetical protein